MTARLETLIGLGRWMIVYAIVYHVIAGGVLVFSSAPLGVTSISTLHDLLGMPHWLLGVTMAAVGVAALGGLLVEETEGIALFLPQQAMLVVAAAGAVDAMQSGHYADGSARSHLFIIVDQLPVVLAAACHTLAIIFRPKLKGP